MLAIALLIFGLGPTWTSALDSGNETDSIHSTSVTNARVTPTKHVGIPLTRSTADREFYLDTVAPRTRNHQEKKNQEKPLASNGSQSDNSTEALLQMILNNIKLKSDSRLRPKLGSKYRLMRYIVVTQLSNC
ncbi:uncharacterized protein LOC116291850 [Actinia tenebrosa]|uniref:Uncharacterized protein LOC116291850 n=1 Tax=Actinia tenebrosa TaxID=6105 RepID=A0A6P8HQG8_ACTTE|nr:uncharacterized protein LOC116291850 [Actinia tenebrosa]